MDRYEATARKAFEAIGNEVVALKQYEMPDEVREGLRRIEVIANHNFNPLPPAKPRDG